MPAHLAPRTDRHRLVGALSVASGVALLTMGVIGFGSHRSGDDGTSGSSATTEPTVLGEVITRPDGTSSTDPAALAAVPATFPGETTTTGGGTSPSTRSGRGRTRSTTTTLPPPDIGTPTSITVPTTRGFPTTTTTPPTTTTTTEPTTTTTEATTTTSTE